MNDLSFSLIVSPIIIYPPPLIDISPFDFKYFIILADNSFIFLGDVRIYYFI